MNRVTRLALPLLAVLVGIVLVIPNSGLEFIGQSLPWVGAGVFWLDNVVPGWDMDHLVAFALLGASARWALRLTHPFWVLGGLCAFAGLTEAAQYWVPGRTASVVDAGLDVAGAVLGYTVAVVLGLGRQGRA